MNKQDMTKYIDHTALKPYVSEKEIEQLCEEAVRFKTASVCIPPNYVKVARSKHPKDLTVCTVIGFPLGYNSTEVKLAETEQCLNEGADEIDMVINITDVKNGKIREVTEEIKKIKALVGGKILKVIVETCYLTEEEKIAMCKAVTEAKADYIKTSTGYGTAGAKIEDIELFKKHIGPGVKIKAAGGIRTLEDFEMFINAGCDRIGTSSAAQVLSD